MPRPRQRDGEGRDMWRHSRRMQDQRLLPAWSPGWKMEDGHDEGGIWRECVVLRRDACHACHACAAGWV
jgi:hypothetical protein